MTFDEFLQKHDMTAYRLGKLTGIDHAMISKYRSGVTKPARHYLVFLDVLSFALDHGYESQDLADGRTCQSRK